jgi:antitoxin component of RelBE/YafQ-DinJ toxin-antitoxin module
VVISVRVRKELKEELERLGIDYAEAVRRFLEELVALKEEYVILVIPLRLRRQLKEELERPGTDNTDVVWRYLEWRVARERRRLALEKAREVREKLRSKVGTLSPSAELIREDRDAGH